MWVYYIFPAASCSHLNMTKQYMLKYCDKSTVNHCLSDFFVFGSWISAFTQNHSSLVQFLDSPDGSEAWWSSRDSAHPLFVREGEAVCTRGERATLSNGVLDRATHRDNICVCTTVCGLSCVTHPPWLVPAVLYQGSESESFLLSSSSSSLHFPFHFYFS